MKKLLIVHQEHSIVCDHPGCDYKIKNPTGDPNIDIKPYLNQRCPKCRCNLLTEKDYLLSLRVLKIINFINKWFSWIMYLVPSSWIAETPEKIATVHVHNGVNIKENGKE